MTVSLPPELERFTRALVESGRYRSAADVVRDSLRLLEARETQAAGLRQQIQDGIDSGPAVPFDGEKLRAMLLQRAADLRAAER